MRKVIYLNNLRSICSSCPREIADPGRLDNATNENNAENSWCGRGDLNPHAFRRHPLKMVCLPVPPLPHSNTRSQILSWASFSRSRFAVRLSPLVHSPDEEAYNDAIRSRNLCLSGVQCQVLQLYLGLDARKKLEGAWR